MTAVAGLTLEWGLDSKLAREIVGLVRDTAFGRSLVAKRVFVRVGRLPAAASVGQPVLRLWKLGGCPPESKGG
jgi:hypothetical protein